MHFSPVSATDVMGAAEAARIAQQAALAKAAHDAAVAQWEIDEQLRKSTLDMVVRRKDSIEYGMRSIVYPSHAVRPAEAVTAVYGRW